MPLADPRHDTLLNLAYILAFLLCFLKGKAAMLQYPDINPVALQFGFLKVHWYGLMYLVGIFGGWGLALFRAKRINNTWTTEQIGDVIFFAALGAVLGGRTGYMLFYDLSHFLAEPWSIFKVWEGGMSFHGGLLGVLLSLLLYSYKFERPFFELTDFIAPLVPIGLGAGRLGNFINCELWGRVTHVSWGMVYPNSLAGPWPRHPAPLYEFFLEGIILFTILWWFSVKPRPRMAVSGLFLLCYGSLRIIGECFRQPDAQLGFLAFNWLTMGQLLSFPMILIGMYLFYSAYNRKI